MVLLVGTCDATWENCSTALDGFLYGGNIGSDGKAKNCTVGSLSFGAWSGLIPRDITVEGKFENCIASVGAFAYTAGGGGNVTFSGIAINCQVSSNGYASAVGSAGEATCSGNLVDCGNIGGGGGGGATGSYGYSASDNGVASGNFIRCTAEDASFGCSDDSTHSGVFSGTASGGCVGLDNCFGSNTDDPILSGFTGTATDCTAGKQSFGARGVFLGTATRCKGGDGSFGDAPFAAASAVLNDCEVLDITAGMALGPPGIHGALVRNCQFKVATGAVAPSLRINGDTSISKIYGCDLYGDASLSNIEDVGPGSWDVKVAQCRMNVGIDATLVNQIGGTAFNTVDPSYSF
jgi:hypothetical protein